MVSVLVFVLGLDKIGATRQHGAQSTHKFAKSGPAGAGGSPLRDISWLGADTARIPHPVRGFSGPCKYLALDDTRAEVHIAMLDEQGRAESARRRSWANWHAAQSHLGRLPRIPAEMNSEPVARHSPRLKTYADRIRRLGEGSFEPVVVADDKGGQIAGVGTPSRPSGRVNPVQLHGPVGGGQHMRIGPKPQSW